MKCPDCLGNGNSFALVHGKPRLSRCPTCNGTCEVSADRADAIERGNAMRLDRMARKVTLRKEAVRLGISPTRLSQMEQGIF